MYGMPISPIDAVFAELVLLDLAASIDLVIDLQPTHTWRMYQVQPAL
jgi:hypothetical protein